MESKKNLWVIEPNNISGWELLWKIVIWMIFGWIIVLLLFLILSFLWWVFTSADNQIWNYNSVSSVLPLLLILIWFLVSFVWNIWVCWIYHLFFANTYHKLGKTIWILALTNWILLLLLIPVYFIFSNSSNTLFLILGFHIILATFLSSQQIESVANPNYSNSSLIWHTLSIAIIMLVYSIIWKVAMNWWSQDKVYLLLLFPPFLAYFLMPFWLWIWDRIYYRMYEVWNNPFFAESKYDEDDIAKWWDEKNAIPTGNDEINVDLN